VIFLGGYQETKPAIFCTCQLTIYTFLPDLIYQIDLETEGCVVLQASTEFYGILWNLSVIRVTENQRNK
jgi:hypothetical protein